MRTGRMALLIWVVTLIFVVLSGLPAQAMNSAAPQAQTTATPKATVYPAGKTGTVQAARLNVRAGPAASQRQVGVLQRRAQVQVLRRQGEWLQIAFKNGPGGKGWVSAAYVAVAGEPTPVPPTARARATVAPSQGSAQRVAAPRAIAYNDPTFSWEWSGQSQATSTPWYFDIQLYTRSGSDPYDVIPATLAQVRQENGVWEFDHRYVARCDSYWVIQIAKGAPGNYQGWISDRSSRQPIGEPCPAPTPDCQDCGG